MSKKNYKIILVEDEPELAQMFCLALERAGFKCLEIIEDGKTAIKKIKETKPDLVLLDLIIPEVNGYEVLATIKKDKKLKNILFYVWSNLTQKDEIEKAKKLGSDGYLIKSDYTPNRLVEKVKEIFLE